MLTTTYAKDQFAPFLSTQDLCGIEGYRRPGGGRSTLTMYYEDDLVASVVRRCGQERYGLETKHGREDSGVAAAERAAAAAAQVAAAQASTDKHPHAVVPAERLGNLGLDKLQAILMRCEGAKVGKLPPSKAGCVERILAAGYSMEQEAAAMATKKAEDEAEEARKAAAREEFRLLTAKREAEVPHPPGTLGTLGPLGPLDTLGTPAKSFVAPPFPPPPWSGGRQGRARRGAQAGASAAVRCRRSADRGAQVPGAARAVQAARRAQQGLQRPEEAGAARVAASHHGRACGAAGVDGAACTASLTAACSAPGSARGSGARSAPGSAAVAATAPHRPQSEGGRGHDAKGQYDARHRAARLQEEPRRGRRDAEGR